MIYKLNMFLHMTDMTRPVSKYVYTNLWTFFNTLIRYSYTYILNINVHWTLRKDHG